MHYPSHYGILKDTNHKSNHGNKATTLYHLYIYCSFGPPNKGGPPGGVQANV